MHKEIELRRISDEILAKIKELDQARRLLKQRAEAKSLSIAQYDSSLARTLIILSNSEVFEFEGVKYNCPKVTILKDIAKGMCFKEKIEMDKNEALYKNCIVTMESIKAIMNALQSIAKYQAEI